MIKSTLQLADVTVVLAFSNFFKWFKGHIRGQENGAGDGLGMRLFSFTSQGLYTTCENGVGNNHYNHNSLNQQLVT